MLGRFEMLPSLRQRVERSRDNDFTTLASDNVAYFARILVNPEFSSRDRGATRVSSLQSASMVERMLAERLLPLVGSKETIRG